MLKTEPFKKLKKSTKIVNLVIDKVDLHLALDLEDELKETGSLVQPFLNTNPEDIFHSKIVITSNEQDKAEGFDEIKSAFMGDRKTVIIKLKEQAKSTTRFESIGHLVVECDSEVQKFLAFYTLTKFNILKGKTLIFVDSLFEAYKVKIFLEKFFMRSSIVNPEATKISRKSAVRYFHAGQYDFLILIRMKYSYKLRTNDVVTVVNFTTPQNIQDYTLAAHKLGLDAGSVLTFTYTENAKVHENKEDKYMLNLIRKMKKRYGRSLFTVLPMHWDEVNKLKSRVDDIVCTLTNKKIKAYMSNEVKKQILNNKNLKGYFEEHEEEKEILKSSIESDYKYRHMHKNLDFVPDYLLPKSIIKSEIQMEMEGEAKPAEGIQGLTSDLIFVQNLNNIPKPRENIRTLPYEDPDKIDPERLEFTAGRKLWKLKHKKRVRKFVKKAKDGYIGS